MTWWQILLLLWAAGIVISLIYFRVGVWLHKRAQVDSMRQRKDVKGLLKALGNSKYSWERKEIIVALGAVGDVRAVAPLLDVLKEKSTEEWEAAATALSQFADPRAIPLLIDGLAQDERRALAATELSRYGQNALKPLVGALKHTNPSIASEAARALGQLGSAEAIPALVEALRHTHHSVRSQAYTALSILKWQPVTPEDTAWALIAQRKWTELAQQPVDIIALLLRVVGDPDDKVRAGAVTALGQTGDQRAVEPLIKALSDGVMSIQTAAAQALGDLRDKRAIEPLKQVLKTKSTSSWYDSTVDLRKAVVNVLATFEGAAAGEALREALDDTNATVRANAAAWLGKRGDEDAIAGLIKTLDDRDKDASAAARKALAQFGEKVVPALVDALNRSVGSTTVKNALIEAGAPAAAPLRAALVDPAISQEYRKSVVQALEGLQAKNAVPDLSAVERAWMNVAKESWNSVDLVAESAEPLIHALDHENWRVRSSVAGVLVKIGSTINPRLCEVFRDEANSPIKRAWAAHVLKKLKASSSISVELNAFIDRQIADLQSSSALTRRIAVEALRTVADAKHAEAPIIAALEKEQDPDVIKHMAITLGQYHSMAAADVLGRKLLINSSKVRRAVSQALIAIGNAGAIQHLERAMNLRDRYYRTKGYSEMNDALDALRKKI